MQGHRVSALRSEQWPHACTLLPLQVATDALVAMERAMTRDGIQVNDRQLACARINSQEGQDYLTAMACAGMGWLF